ncbi:6-carboxytetrahydropterin synthase QueD [Lolliginicoccus suaedae]|uniref:6-carboxytetrahydropterin synthase QueD n=1 Tax=Lolliginicoccus suaedae TaxID=2605429 RepID=UPI001CA8471A|nr:6-carboxytetrahydropterin synthase QueD [Lolliginicoccus suaedae]
MIEIFKEFDFEAAHRLPNVPEGHKCARLHGHSYRFTVHVAGQPDPELGWVVDFAEVKRVVAPIVRELDHYFLNDIEGLENPTSENLAMWLWHRIEPLLEGLSAVTVRETCTSGCTYRG